MAAPPPPVQRFAERLGSIAALMAFLALPGPSVAQAPQVTMIGLGAGMTCTEWLDEGRHDEAVEQWAFGFASAVAATLQAQGGGDPLASLDATRIHAWLAVYCTTRPADRITLGIVRMLHELAR